MTEGAATIQTPGRIGFDEIMAALDGIDFLSHIKGSKRKKFLGTLIKESFLRTYAHDEKIVRQGEHGHTMFVLLNGTVSVDAVVDGEERHLATMQTVLGKTIWFGEGVVLGRTPRNATVSAVGPSILLEIEKIRLEKLDMLAVGVIDGIEKASENRAMEGFLRQHRAFSALNEMERNTLVSNGSINHVDRGDQIFAAGSGADSVLIIKQGVAKLVREGATGTSVLAYFNAGDCVGVSDGPSRPGALEAMGYVEYIKVARAQFNAVKHYADERIQLANADGNSDVKWSDQLNKALNAGGGTGLLNPSSAMSSKTGMIFIEEFIKEGAQLAQSLLTIDLDLCIRCGNCVRACESRHGHAKFTRRGKKLVRRRDKEGSQHQPLLLPSSCRHCDSPECMIGCPTGAIHRKPTGEVAIHDFCIGCSNCALRCPWDNITMVETPGRWVLDRVTNQNLATPKIASKCTLCAGYDEANCVNNCPTRAILRVEPSYFPEVREAIGQSASGGDQRTYKEERFNWSRLVITLIAALFCAGLVAIYRSAEPYFAFSVQGFILGMTAMVLFLAATALAFRRRLRKFPLKPPHPDEPANKKKAGLIQLGPYYLWTRAHVWLGGLGCFAVMLHCDLRTGGVITSLLFGLVVLEFITGIMGLAYYKWIPSAITRLERESQVQEDVEEERENLRIRRDELLEEEPIEVLRAARKVDGAAGNMFTRFFGSYDSAAAEGKALERLAKVLDPLDRTQTGIVQRLARDAVRLKEIKAMLWMYRARRGWLALHITITSMLLTLALVHIGAVAYFYLRIG